MKKYVAIMLVIVMFVCLLCACNNDNDSTTIKLNEVTHSVFYAPLYVAINMGYFEEENITIELTNGGGSDKTMTAIMSEGADIGLLGPETAVYVKQGGSSNYPVVFGQLTQKDGSFIIGRTNENEFCLNDLIGKEIIGGRKGGMPAMSLEYALKKAGIYDKVTINYDVQFNLITASFEGGTGDYCTMFEPTASNYQQNGKGYVLDSVGVYAGNMPYTCFMAKKDYILNNRAVVKGFMRAILKAINYVETEKDEVIAETLLPSFPDTSKSIIASSVSAYKQIDAYKSNPSMSEEEYNNLINVLVASGTLTGKVEYKDIIDNSIVDEIK